MILKCPYPYQSMPRLAPLDGEFKGVNVYVGCALTGADPVYVEMVKAFKDALRPYVTVYDFLGLAGGRELSPEVYRRDIHECIKYNDLFIAFCDLPSTGLGFELGTQIEHLRKPTLVLSHVNTNLTRLVIGASMLNDHVWHFEYSHFDQLHWVAIDAIRKCLLSKSADVQEDFLTSVPTRYTSPVDLFKHPVNDDNRSFTMSS